MSARCMYNTAATFCKLIPVMYALPNTPDEEDTLWLCFRGLLYTRGCRGECGLCRASCNCCMCCHNIPAVC